MNTDNITAIIRKKLEQKHGQCQVNRGKRLISFWAGNTCIGSISKELLCDIWDAAVEVNKNFLHNKNF